jgi:hypothetical protein
MFFHLPLLPRGVGNGSNVAESRNPAVYEYSVSLTLSCTPYSFFCHRVKEWPPPWVKDENNLPKTILRLLL